MFATTVGETLFCRECGGIENHGNVDETPYSDTYYVTNYCSIESQQFCCFTDILRNIDAYVVVRRVLDVGCGTGILLKSAYSLGYRDSVGIDSSVCAIDIARKNLTGTDVAVKTNSEKILDKFGVISFMDSIAHIDDLECCILSLISKNLDINGVVIIKTPRYSKAYFYYGLILGTMLRLIGKQHFVSRQVFFMPARLFLFTEKSLDAFMVRLGLVKVSISVQSEYVRSRPKMIGVKARAADFFFSKIPDFIRGQKQTIIYTARKCLSSVS
ncbi:MAG: class I SAM-dependent methyltransferase [Desulfobulbaceae bacterium]|nr:class I SAM-dependent methyltransferase [Desulfobulbaceae bacterium]